MIYTARQMRGQVVRRFEQAVSTFGRRQLLVCLIFIGLVLLSACRSSPVVQETETVSLRETLDIKPTAASLEFLSQVESLLPAYAGDLDALPDLPHYRLQVGIDPDSLSYQGYMQLEYTNLETVALESLYLRLYPNGGESYGSGEITLSNMLLDGEPVSPRYSLSSSVVEVPLPKSLLPGSQVQLSLDFLGEVPADFGGEATPYAYGIFNSSERVLALSGWYPILAVYDQDGWNLDPVRPVGDAVFSDMAYYSVEVTLPASDQLAATGVELDRRLQGQEQVLRLASGPVRDFFLILSPAFQVSSLSLGEVKVNVYSMGDLPEIRQYMLDVAEQSVSLFDQKFGAYPYRELDVVQAPMRNAGGVEFPGIVLIEAGRSQQVDNPLLATTVAHEVAHQWWYNLVGNDVIEEPWVDEALATYSSMLYWEAAFGPQAYASIRADFQTRYDRAVESEVPGKITDGIEFYSQPENTSGYGAIVYMKGALFFAALRDEIGDEAFFEALQAYYQAHRYGIASGQELLDAFEAAAGRSLTEFYRQWSVTG